MSITYNSLVSELAAITVITSNTLTTGDANFPANVVTAAIDYSEGRIYRDLDLPAVRVTDTTVTISCGVRNANLSTAQGEPLAIESFCISTGAGGTLIPIVPTSLALINTIYPSAASSNCGVPVFFARVNNLQVAFGPTPDIDYATQVITTIRPTPLSAANSSTWLSQNLPELLVAGCMVFMAGYMRDGSQAGMLQVWEAQFQALIKSAAVDSFRQKFQSAAWSDQAPSPLATPPRA